MGALSLLYIFREAHSVAKKRVEVNRLGGVESVMSLSHCGKFEINALVDGEPVKMLKDGG